MVWPRFKIYWLGKDNPTGHDEEVDRRGGGKTISKSGQGWTPLVQLGQMKTERWRGIAAKSSVVTRRHSMVMG